MSDTATPEARTAVARDDGNPITTTDLDMAAAYLIRAAAQLREAEKATHAVARLVAFEVSKLLTKHAVAIVLGEKDAYSNP